jgi:hypothetical protein
MTTRLFDKLRNGFLIVALLLVAGGNPTGAALPTPVDPSSSYLPYVGYTPAIQVARYSPACNIGNTLRILGDVINQGSRPAYDVAVEMRVYDSENNLLGIEETNPVMTATLPQQLNPFDEVLSIGCEVYPLHYELEVRSWSWESDQSYLPLTVVYSETVEDFGLGAWVNVEFRNDARSTLSDVRGVAWSTTQKYMIHSQLLTDSLMPGETVTMTEYLYGVYGLSLSTIRVAGQGMAVP